MSNEVFLITGIKGFISTHLYELILKKYPNSTFVGKTNKDNLVFEHNNKTIRITPKGDII